MMLRALYPIYNTGQGVAYTCLSLCEYLGDDLLPAEAWFPSSEIAFHYSFVRNAYPRWAMPLMYRLPQPEVRLARGTERAFVRSLRPGDIAYLWPGVALQTYRRMERTSCYRPEADGLWPSSNRFINGVKRCQGWGGWICDRSA